MTGTRSRRYHSRYCVGTSPANKPARSPASPSSPSLSKARKRGTTGSPRKRKFEDDALNDEELSLKVVSVMALPGEENQGKMSCQVKSKDQTRLETIEGEPRPPPAMDPCISLDMQDAYDLGPIMSPLPCDSISIDTMVPSTLGYWDSLLRAESPDPLDTISDERNNELLASDDDLDPLAFTDSPMTRHSLEQITTVFLAKATLDKVIFDAETDRIEPIEALKELRRVSDMLAEILDGFGDD